MFHQLKEIWFIPWPWLSHIIPWQIVVICSNHWTSIVIVSSIMCIIIINNNNNNICHILIYWYSKCLLVELPNVFSHGTNDIIPSVHRLPLWAGPGGFAGVSPCQPCQVRQVARAKDQRSGGTGHFGTWKNWMKIQHDTAENVAYFRFITSINQENFGSLFKLKLGIM